MATITVNGQQHTVTVSADTPLLWVLRDVLGLTGTKYGCGIAVCGACTVLVDGEPEKSCDMDFGEAAGRRITTVEGLSANGTHPFQKAWVAEQVPQCGYCQPGMLMHAAGLAAGHGRLTDGDINEIDNVCACGTYQRIRAAIHSAQG